MHSADENRAPDDSSERPSPPIASPAQAEGIAGREDIVPQSVPALREFVGDAVFLPCNAGPGGKGPILPKFQKLTVDHMTPGHIAQCERPDYRIGILLGTNSGGLCGLDCDCDEFAAEMLRINPWLAQTLTTTCNRGCTYWLRVTDRWPRTATLYLRGHKVGEWRSDGHQSVIAGQDTKTKTWRRFVHRKPVVAIPMCVLCWPDELDFGGDKNRSPWPPAFRDDSLFVTLSRSAPPQIAGRGDVERTEDVERNLRSTPSSCARSTSAQKTQRNERAEKQKRLYRKFVSRLKAQAGDRNALLTRAVPFLIHVVCEKLVSSFLMQHFDQIGTTGGWSGTREEHQKSVEGLIAGCLASYPAKLTPSERSIYERLRDGLDRAAFRICRNLANYDDTKNNNPPGIFPLSYGELAARLDCSNSIAEELLKKRFRDGLRLLEIESCGLRREKGQPNIATRWRWHGRESAQ